MATLEIQLATRADDAALLDFMKTTTLPGEITVAMQREPSLFAASAAMGEVHQVFVSRDGARVVGMAERAERRCYVNGSPEPVGYISGVRVDAEHRGGATLFRGFRFLRGLHARGAAGLYLTTIARDNAAARAVLTSGRAGLPAYHPAGTYVTAAVPARRGVAPAPLADGEVCAATAADLPELIAFLAREGARRQFFPAIASGELAALAEAPASGRLAGIALPDVLLAWRGGQVVGTMARWDQRAYKQWQLVSYGWKMTLARPVFALLARACGWPELPAPGTRIAGVYAALVAVAEEDPGVYRALLTALLAAERERGGAFVSIGMLSDDPLLAVTRTLSPFLFHADLFVVTFDEAGARRCAELDRRRWYVELATL